MGILFGFFEHISIYDEGLQDNYPNVYSQIIRHFSQFWHKICEFSRPLEYCLATSVLCWNMFPNFRQSQNDTQIT